MSCVDMAFTVASLPPPPLLVHGTKTLFGSLPKPVWDSSEDRLALVGLGFAAIAALWTSVNIIAWFVYRYLLFKPDRYCQKSLVDEL
ncbi:hypothetical protein Tsubulata_033095 [Turnera subulata]|uniref:Uncharacterized protein n=1 Tax=Turnera subulata TaxID=218843 RepID=A0A9Q0F2W3_9ROSI|nr:hypothetical protein Tsubulata_033095 [Turnera subulata]